MTTPLVAVFDLDGTLIDSDRALMAPFLALGVDPATVPWGLPLPEACARVGISAADYLAHYDETLAGPFPGIEALLTGLDRWAVCSNKHPDSGPAELRRLGWAPDVAWFNDGHGPKRLGPVLDELGLEPEEVVFVGDTGHDRQCAAAAGCRFVLAGWNPRAERRQGDEVVDRPSELGRLLA